MSDAARAAAEHLTRREAQVVLDALNKRLPPGVTVAEVYARTRCEYGDDGQTYLFDGAPFLWVSKPVVTENDDGSLSVDRQWRELP